MLKKNLPLIELTIDPEEDSFVQAVALVEHPANEMQWLSFAKNEQLKFAADDLKKELLGVALIPNQVIYRNSPELGEYACTFSKDTIREISQVFARKGFFNNTNLEHSLIPADSYIFQSYIVDTDKGILAPKALGSVPIGSWVLGLKVLSDQVWSDIQSKKITGLSVEGLFGMIDTKTTVNLSKQYLLSELETAFKELAELEQLKDNI
ncbi:XkdF-like putative serine protease domain-containing protein [Mucilaginibacter kameinonensis]|uniref:XkdF-like putative serine protease domain-containing protein n=1 Tax=Mucilaginibacter kameinonensis TaxID=452286 RepID=UPI000EF77DED|nr:XkdF-like putative serine protease domain-containing protein [Mucilaginibacter kameinonensis]